MESSCILYKTFLTTWPWKKVKKKTNRVCGSVNIWFVAWEHSYQFSWTYSRPSFWQYAVSGREGCYRNEHFITTQIRLEPPTRPLVSTGERLGRSNSHQVTPPHRTFNTAPSIANSRLQAPFARGSDGGSRPLALSPREAASPASPAVQRSTWKSPGFSGTCPGSLSPAPLAGAGWSPARRQQTGGSFLESIGWLSRTNAPPSGLWPANTKITLEGKKKKQVEQN